MAAIFVSDNHPNTNLEDYDEYLLPKTFVKFPSGVPREKLRIWKINDGRRTTDTRVYNSTSTREPSASVH